MVNGAVMIDNVGIDVAQVKLSPLGLHTECVINGFNPCEIAYGHQYINHIKDSWSLPGIKIVCSKLWENGWKWLLVRLSG